MRACPAPIGGQGQSKTVVAFPMPLPVNANCVSRSLRLRVRPLHRLPPSRLFPQRFFDSRDSLTRKSRRCALNPLMSQLLWLRILRRIAVPNPPKTTLRPCPANRLLTSRRSFCPLRGWPPVVPNYWYESRRSFHRHSFPTTT